MKSNLSSFLCCLCLWCHLQEIIAKSNVVSFCCFFSQFYGLGLMFSSVIHFELIFLFGIRQESPASFTNVAISFPSTIVEKIVLSPLVLLPLLKINWPSMQGLILESLFYSVGPYVYRPVPYWLLLLCSKFWNQDVSLFFFLKMVPWDSMWIWG